MHLNLKADVSSVAELTSGLDTLDSHVPVLLENIMRIDQYIDIHAYIYIHIYIYPSRCTDERMFVFVYSHICCTQP